MLATGPAIINLAKSKVVSRVACGKKRVGLLATTFFFLTEQLSYLIFNHI